KKHLAINADMALGLGDYAMIRGTYDADLVARCMKTGTPYRVSEPIRIELHRGRCGTRKGRGCVWRRQQVLGFCRTRRERCDLVGSRLSPGSLGPVSVVSLVDQLD